MRPRRLRRGQKPALGHINQFVTSVDELRKQVRQLSGRHQPAELPAVRAWALNGTGQDLRMGDAAAVQAGIAATFERLLEDGPVLKLKAFETGSTAANDSGNWVVAENEIKDGEIGRVWVAGVCPARASGTGAYVDAPTDGSAVLERSASAGAKIIQEIEDTVAAGGEKWVLIRIGTIAKDQPGGGASLADNTGVIKSSTPVVGSATTAKRSDGADGLGLVGNPATVEDDARAHSGFRFYKKTAGAGGALLGGGVQPKVYGSPGEVEATKQPMGVDAGGMYGQVSDEGGNAIEVTEKGLFYDGTPAAHKARHQKDGDDEINIAGLAGEGADEQKPKIHGLTAEASPADADEFPFYDSSAGANRKVTGANLKTYIGAGGGGLTVDSEYLGSPGSTSSNPIIDNVELGADGNYLVWFQAKFSGNTGVCRMYLQFTEDMTTYTVGEAHGYINDGTEGKTLLGFCLLAGWDNDRRLFLTCEAAAATTIEAQETSVVWAKY